MFSNRSRQVDTIEAERVAVMGRGGTLGELKIQGWTGGNGRTVVVKTNRLGEPIILGGREERKTKEMNCLEDRGGGKETIKKKGTESGHDQSEKWGVFGEP